MKLLITLTLFVSLIKAYTYNSYQEKLVINEQALSFIQYDLDTKRLENLIKNQTRTILDLAKSDSNLYTTSQELINNLSSSSNGSIEKHLLIFNSSVLKDLLNFPPIEFKQNNGLSIEHNLLMTKSHGYSVLISLLYQKKKLIPKERPYLISLERDKDSLDLLLGIAMHGKINDLILVHKSDTIKVDSLPINIGPINGELSFIFTDSPYENRICYSKKY